MTTPALDRLRGLPGFRTAGRNQWQARCPGHDDLKASLSIGQAEDGRVLLHCHAGCDLAAILRAVGIQERDLFTDNGSERRIIAMYDYRTATGELSFQVVRFDPKDFRQRRPDGKGGWTWNTRGLPRLPYRLPELLSAEYVHVTEGEKDADALAAIGLVATTNPGGAGKWPPDFGQYFQGKHVTIIPDNDPPGRVHAEAVARSLAGVAGSTKVLPLPGLPEKGDVSDWLAGRDPLDAAEELCRLSEAAEEWRPARPRPNGFEQIAEDRYRLTLAGGNITLEVDRLRRERHDLIGELAVRCELPGALTYDGTLSAADLNLSSARARAERGRLLAARAQTGEGFDWQGSLEELCQRVLASERTGKPAVDLRTLPKPAADDEIAIGSFRIPRRHSSVIFGDGGACKSYLALYDAGILAQRDFRVALFDWELSGEDHRLRLERLFGLFMPELWYARCEKALIYEVDRLKRIVQDNRIDFTIFDSVAFACDGAPESAEVACQYFRAVRQIQPASLHIAHVKAENGDQRPFGSIFWSNSARSTWFAKLAYESPDNRIVTIGLFNRKANLECLHRPAGFRFTFEPTRTHVEPAQPADVPDLAEKLTVREKLLHVLRGGAMPVEELADTISEKPDTVRRTVSRHKGIFTLLDGGKVALLQRDM